MDENFVLDQFIKVPRGAAVNGWRPDAPDFVKKENPELLELVKRCWAQDYHDRPEFKEVHEEMLRIAPANAVYEKD